MGRKTVSEKPIEAMDLAKREPSKNGVLRQSLPIARGVVDILSNK